MKSDVERQRLMRSTRSSAVRGVRDRRDRSFLRSVSMTLMHFWRGIEGNRASASNDTRISSSSILIFLIFLTNSAEFLQAKGEFLSKGRRMGMRRDERPS